MNSLVSIIIPSYNRAYLISETLDSIMEQTYDNWECIIVDDGSTDNSNEVIDKYLKADSRFQYHKRPENKLKGANACRNFGLSIIKGDYIIFLDSDDLLSKMCLKNRITLFREYEHYDFLVFSMGFFENSNNCYKDKNRKIVNLSIEETIFEFVCGRLPWQTTAPIYKSRFLYGRIWFNEKIQNFQDDEFHIRVLGILKPKYLFLDETDYYYRIDNQSLNKYSDVKGHLNIIDSLFEYYSAVIDVLDNTIGLKSIVIHRLLWQIYTYLLPKNDDETIKKTIVFLSKELKLNIKEKAILSAMCYLNKYYYHKKGHYFLYKYFKSNLNK